MHSKLGGEWLCIILFSVYTQAGIAKMFKEGMTIEAKHVRKWVWLDFGDLVLPSI